MNTELQAYFDKTLDHLMAQGQPALNASGDCVYRTDGGLSCAVGCHIPDGHDALDSGYGLDGLVNFFPGLAGVAWVDSKEGRALADELQDLHDLHDGSDQFSSASFAHNAQTIASEHNLTFRLRPGMHGYEEPNGDGTDSGETHE